MIILLIIIPEQERLSSPLLGKRCLRQTQTENKTVERYVGMEGKNTLIAHTVGKEKQEGFKWPQNQYLY